MESAAVRGVFRESGCLGLQPKIGGKLHLKLNMGERPIANKYCEGKMKRTLKRRLKVPEIAKEEALGTSAVRGGISGPRGPCTSASRESAWARMRGKAPRQGRLLRGLSGRGGDVRAGRGIRLVRQTLTEWFQSTRLETRTKECHTGASRRVSNP